MKVINIHKRIIYQAKDNIWQLFEKLATREDQIWPYKKWPAIRLNNELKVGSKGGHGPIRYTVLKKSFEEGVVFKFTGPKGFDGTHEFRIDELSKMKVEVSHTIKMNTSGWDTYYWLFVIRWIHDALIEDAFDNLENQFLAEKKATTYNAWVKCIRLFKPKKGTYQKIAVIEER